VPVKFSGQADPRAPGARRARPFYTDGRTTLLSLPHIFIINGADFPLETNINAPLKEAVARAREGAGPTFVEARVYRFRAHGGAGDDSKTGYRDIAERESWEKHCPVEGFYSLIKAASLIDESRREAMQQTILREILEAFEHALSSPDPTEEDLYRHVYAD